MLLENLANSLMSRFERDGRDDDLDESIALHRASLALRPEGHPNRSDSLHNLSCSLLTRFEQRGDYDELDESIRLRRASLVLYPEGHPYRPASLKL
ncbi:hypothetical protein ACEPAF_9181 [Sanghuangporus sanghuang]